MSQWLQPADHGIQRLVSDSGTIDLRVETDGGETWHIRLMPKSVLASTLAVVATAFPGRINDLDDFIQGYVAGFSANLDTAGLPVPRLVLALLRASVCIRGLTQQGDIQVSGVAVDLRPGNLVLCTAHNLSGVRRLKVEFYDGGEVDAQLARLDVDRDLALLKIESPAPLQLNLSAGRLFMETGERIYAIGCPLTQRNTVRTGTIGGPPRRLHQYPLLEADLKVQPGSSGSPVFDRQGRPVGLVKGRFRGTDTVGFIIPMETIQAFLDDGK